MMFKNATNEPLNYECLLRNEKSTNTIKVYGLLFSKTHTYMQTLLGKLLSNCNKLQITGYLNFKTIIMLQYVVRYVACCLSRVKKLLMHSLLVTVKIMPFKNN